MDRVHSERHKNVLDDCSVGQEFSENACRDLYCDALREDGANTTTLTLREWLDLAEAWRIRQVLRECRGNRSAAARQLGIGRRTLYSKMERLQIASHAARNKTPALAPTL